MGFRSVTGDHSSLFRVYSPGVSAWSLGLSECLLLSIRLCVFFGFWPSLFLGICPMRCSHTVAEALRSDRFGLVAHLAPFCLRSLGL